MFMDELLQTIKTGRRLQNSDASVSRLNCHTHFIYLLGVLDHAPNSYRVLLEKASL